MRVEERIHARGVLDDVPGGKPESIWAGQVESMCLVKIEGMWIFLLSNPQGSRLLSARLQGRVCVRLDSSVGRAAD